jgi:predicted metal-dependent hydrolase
MTTELRLGDIAVDVVQKGIRNVHLSVHPPTGRVRISAPARMNINSIRLFAISKLGWIRQQQKKLRAQEREPPREYLNRESHYLWGRRYLLEIVKAHKPPSIELTPRHMKLTVRPRTRRAQWEVFVARWYRDQLRAVLPELALKWERLLGVSVRSVTVRQMKTKWGSCNHRANTIQLNTELAKKPLECLDYVLLHEMAHLLEPTHGARFVALMDQFMPNWRFIRQTLNELPVRHAEWEY